MQCEPTIWTNAPNRATSPHASIHLFPLFIFGPNFWTNIGKDWRDPLGEPKRSVLKTSSLSASSESSAPSRKHFTAKKIGKFCQNFSPTKTFPDEERGRSGIPGRMYCTLRCNCNTRPNMQYNILYYVRYYYVSHHLGIPGRMYCTLRI